jgi:hypothetical protein
VGKKTGAEFLKELSNQISKQIEFDKKNEPEFNKAERYNKSVVYRDAMVDVLNRTPSGMLERMDDGVKSFQFYNDLKQLTGAANWPTFGASDETVGGTYTRSKGRLRLDGIERGFEGGIEGVYAHELTHAADCGSQAGVKGAYYELSENDDWEAAWNEEIVRPGKKPIYRNLTDYAAQSPVEGFAEFGRLVITAKHRLSYFPKATKYWKENGLL